MAFTCSSQQEHFISTIYIITLTTFVQVEAKESMRNVLEPTLHSGLNKRVHVIPIKYPSLMVPYWLRHDTRHRAILSLLDIDPSKPFCARNRVSRIRCKTNRASLYAGRNTPPLATSPSCFLLDQPNNQPTRLVFLLCSTPSYIHDLRESQLFPFRVPAQTKILLSDCPMAERILMNEYRSLAKEKWVNIEVSGGSWLLS